MKDNTTDEREQERREKAARTREVHESEAIIAGLEFDKKSLMRKRQTLEEEMRRLKTELVREQKALEEEIQRRKVAIDRFTVNLEGKEKGLRPLEAELAEKEEEIARAKRQMQELKDL